MCVQSDTDSLNVAPVVRHEAKIQAGEPAVYVVDTDTKHSLHSTTTH